MVGHSLDPEVLSRSKVLGFGFLGLEKVLVKCDLRANSGPQLGFVNKVLLPHSHTHSLMHLYGCLRDPRAELTVVKRTWSTKLR